MTELKCCPVCDREWPDGCEQAASVELFGECIVCRFTPGGKVSMSGTDDDLRAICVKAHGPDYKYRSPNQIISDFEAAWNRRHVPEAES